MKKFNVADVFFSEIDDSEEEDREETQLENPQESDPKVNSTWEVKDKADLVEPEKIEEPISEPEQAIETPVVRKVSTKKILNKLNKDFTDLKQQLRQEINKEIIEAVKHYSSASPIAGITVGSMSSLSDSDMLLIYEFGAKNSRTFQVQPLSSGKADVINDLPSPPFGFSWFVNIKAGLNEICFEITALYDGDELKYSVFNMVGEFAEFNTIVTLVGNSLHFSIQNTSNIKLEINLKRKY